VGVFDAALGFRRDSSGRIRAFVPGAPNSSSARIYSPALTRRFGNRRSDLIPALHFLCCPEGLFGI